MERGGWSVACNSPLDGLLELLFPSHDLILFHFCCFKDLSSIEARLKFENERVQNKQITMFNILSYLCFINNWSLL